MSRFVKDMTIVGDTEKLLQNTPENYSEGKVRVNVEGEVEFKNVNFGYEEERDLAEQNPADAPNSLPEKEKTENKKKIFSLNNINLKINKGQKVAFVGESGGGKSTSVELIGGFYFPNKGDILIDGVSTKEINLNDLRSSMAYVSQDIAIFNTTIGENISYGAKTPGLLSGCVGSSVPSQESCKMSEKTSSQNMLEKEVEQAAKLANISDFINSLPDGYATKVGEKGLKLSGGQKQRIAIARAILRNPKILILDEPTSALDIESETKITSTLKEVMKNRTTIIIAHRISTVRDADNIFVFKNGKIVEGGDYQKLTSRNGEFKKMVNLHEGLN
jgi:ABC-type multidrug transport system fused ATPase/permease subunit